MKSGVESWNNLFAGKRVVNMGCGWDRIENVLWRVYHDELDGFDAKKIFIKIGTNNLELSSDQDIVTGIDRLIKAVKVRQPKAEICMLGILPRENGEQRVEVLNKLIEKLAANNGIAYLNVGMSLLKESGKIDASLFRDGLHPNEAGYERIMKILKKQL